MLSITKEMFNLISDRCKLRQEKQFQKADKIRDILLKKYYIELEDGKDNCVTVFSLKPQRECIGIHNI